MKYKKWTSEEIELLNIWCTQDYTCKEIASELNRTYDSIKCKLKELNLICKKEEVKLTQQDYDKKLKLINPLIIRVEEYKGYLVPILHECFVCTNKSKSSPANRLLRRKCKFCCYKEHSGRLSENLPSICYLVYIPKYDLYKIGITEKSVKERMADNNIRKYESVLERHFKSGIDTMKLEKEWLSNIQKYKLNTGLLKTGNTETFRV